MTGTGRVELPPPVRCVVVDALKDALLDVLVDGTEGLLWRGGGIPSPPMGSGSIGDDEGKGGYASGMVKPNGNVEA
jgi:hypothetical protein